MPPNIVDAALKAEAENAQNVASIVSRKRGKNVGHKTPAMTLTETTTTTTRVSPEVTWEPPFKDATDIVIQRLLDPATLQPMDGFSAEEWKRRASLTSWPEAAKAKIEF